MGAFIQAGEGGTVMMEELVDEPPWDEVGRQQHLGNSENHLSAMRLQLARRNATLLPKRSDRSVGRSSGRHTKVGGDLFRLERQSEASRLGSV
jgi:hypothetical protein